MKDSLVLVTDPEIIAAIERNRSPEMDDGKYEPLMIRVPDEIDDLELRIINMCVWLLEHPPHYGHTGRNFTDVEKQRIVEYLAQRYSPNAAGEQSK